MALPVSASWKTALAATLRRSGDRKYTTGHGCRRRTGPGCGPCNCHRGRLSLVPTFLDRGSAGSLVPEFHVAPGESSCLEARESTIGRHSYGGQGQGGAPQGGFCGFHPIATPTSGQLEDLAGRARESEVRASASLGVGVRLRQPMMVSATTGWRAGLSPFRMTAAAWKWQMAERACCTLAMERPVADRLLR